MGRLSINATDLTKKRVAELKKLAVGRREDLEACFETHYRNGVVNRPEIMELSDGTLLMIDTDPLIPGTLGKGSLFYVDVMERWAESMLRMKRDIAAGRGSSVSHWFFYSRLKKELIHHVSSLVVEMSNIVHPGGSKSPSTYADLDPISRFINSIDRERAKVEYYDHLVAYVGEVLRVRTDGVWKIREVPHQQSYPWVDSPKHDVIMPVNVVWEELNSMDNVDFRKKAVSEMRTARLRYYPDSKPR